MTMIILFVLEFNPSAYIQGDSEGIVNILGGVGARGGAVFEALRYKPEGRGSIPEGTIGIFH
jgi:hypothetical protein